MSRAPSAEAVPLYLADTSIWIGARNRPGSYLPRLLAQRIAADEIATCVPVALEVLTGPPTGEALDRDWDQLWRHLRWLPVVEATTNRALDLLRGLAHSTAGAHRRRPIDYLIAASAEAAAEAVLWHWDMDLAVICEHAGIEHEPEHERARQHGIDVASGPSDRRKPSR